MAPLKPGEALLRLTPDRLCPLAEQGARELLLEEGKKQVVGSDLGVSSAAGKLLSARHRLAALHGQSAGTVTRDLD